MQAASKDNSITVTIRKWNELNPRKDIKRASWFRINHDLIEDPDFFDFTGEEFKVWIYLLCQASKKSNAQITVNREHAHRVCNISEKTLHRALQKLQKIHAIEVRTLRGRYAHVTSAFATLHNITEQDTTKQTTLAPSGDGAGGALDLEQVYKAYPRKRGKKRGLELARRRVRSQEQLEQLMKAVTNYAEECRAENRAPDKIKYFDTFMGCWEDWVNPETEAEDLQQYVLKAIQNSPPGGLAS